MYQYFSNIFRYQDQVITILWKSKKINHIKQASCSPRNNRFILHIPYHCLTLLHKEKKLQLCHHDRLYPKANGGGSKIITRRNKMFYIFEKCSFFFLITFYLLMISCCNFQYTNSEWIIYFKQSIYNNIMKSIFRKIVRHIIRFYCEMVTYDIHLTMLYIILGLTTYYDSTLHFLVLTIT